jgi:hypothetical protein
VVSGGKDKNGVTINDTTTFMSRITREGSYQPGTYRVRDLQHFFTFVTLLFAFGLSAKLMPKALELLFPPHPPLFVEFFFEMASRET